MVGGKPARTGKPPGSQPCVSRWRSSSLTARFAVQLLGEAASLLGAELGHPARRGRDQRGDLAHRQTRKAHNVGAVLASQVVGDLQQGPVETGAADRAENEQPCAVHAPHQVSDELEGGWVRPVQVLQRKEQGRVLRGGRHEPGDRFEQPVAGRVGTGGGLRSGAADQTGKARQQPHDRTGRSTNGPGENLLRCRGDQRSERLDDGLVRRQGLFVAVSHHHGGAISVRGHGRLRDQAAPCRCPPPRR